MISSLSGEAAQWCKKTDPRLKILLLALLIVAVLSTWKVLTLLTYLVLSFLVFFMSGLKFRHMLSMYEESTVFMLLFTLGLALSGSGHVVHIWIVPLSISGIMLGLKVALKLYSIMTLVVYTFHSTCPSDLVVALRRLGLPHKIALTLLISLRYIQEIHDKMMFMLRYARLRGYRPVLSIETLRSTGLVITNLLIRYSHRSTVLSQIMRLRTFGDLPDIRVYSRTYTMTEPIHLILAAVIMLIILLDKLNIIPCITRI